MWHRAAGIAFLLGALGAAWAAEKGAELAPVPVGPETGKPLRTYVFAMNQIRVTMGKQYLHAYLDRPLLFDRALDRQGEVMTAEGFLADAGAVRRSGLDGFCLTCAWPYKVRMGLMAYRFADQAGLPDFRMPIYFYGNLPDALDGNPQGRLELRCKFIEGVLASNHAMLLNGKLVSGAWLADARPPEFWTGQLKAFRERFGDRVLFAPELANPPRPWYAYKNEFYANRNRLSEKSVAELKPYIRKYLDAADGVMINYSLAPLKLMYNYKFAHEFYRDGMIPVLKSVLSEPKYRNKLLGLEATNGFYNCMSMNLTDPDCTKTLRRSFEAAMTARPDFIMLAEWNEIREETYFMPTVYNGYSTARVLNYYVQQIKGQPPHPYGDDDRSTPNLIISYRKGLKWGEPLEIEVLNVPDSPQKGEFGIQIALTDAGGKEVMRLPAAALPRNAMQDKTYSIATEDLPAYSVLRPRLEVTGADGRRKVYEDGLHYILIRPTWNFNLKYVKQPLREVIQPGRASFTFKKRADGQVEASGDFACNEEIKSVEVLEDDHEVAAVDPANEFPDRETNAVLRLDFKANTGSNLTGTLDVRGCKYRVFEWENIPSPDTSSFLPREGDGPVQLRCRLWAGWEPQGLFLFIPKADCGRAALALDTNFVKTEIPVSRILENGACAETYSRKGFSFTVTAERFDLLPRVPCSIHRKQARFRTVVTPIARACDPSVYHVRVITASGRIYRSAPTVFMPAAKEAQALLSVYSFSRDQVVARKLAKDCIPNIVYDFDGRCGALLPTASGRAWYAKLGPLEYHDNAFRDGQWYPKHAERTAPEWATEDGEKCLRFDGVGNFMIFPREALPRGAFTLRFRIKALSPKRQTLITMRSRDPGPLHVMMENGRLFGTYEAQLKKGDPEEWSKTYRLEPDISIPIGRWATVEIRYDLHNFTFSVDGREGKPTPCDRTGFLIEPMVFGGFGAGAEWFEGYLSSFSVVHGN